MRKTLLSILLLSSMGAIAQTQNVGIGTTTPNSNAILDLTSTNKGLLLPRVALTGTSNAAPMTAHTAGLTVYNTATAADVTPGTYFNNGTKWVRVADAQSGAWNNLLNIQKATDINGSIYRSGSTYLTDSTNYNMFENSYSYFLSPEFLANYDTAFSKEYKFVSNSRSRSNDGTFYGYNQGILSGNALMLLGRGQDNSGLIGTSSTINLAVGDTSEANDSINARSARLIKYGLTNNTIFKNSLNILNNGLSGVNMAFDDSNNIRIIQNHYLTAYNQANYFFKANGNFGIGTVNPVGKLHIRYQQDPSDTLNKGFSNDIVFDNYEPSSNDGLSLAFRRYRGTVSGPINILTNDRLGGFNFMGQVNNTLKNLGLIGAIYKGDGTTQKSTMYFAVNSGEISGPNNEIALYLDSSKYVGIGTMNPTALLHLRNKIGLMKIDSDSAWAGVVLNNHNIDPFYFSAFVGTKNRGSVESPVYSNLGDITSWVGGRDYKTHHDATLNPTLSTGGSAILFVNEENISETNKGAGILFETTLKGSTIPGIRMKLNDAGNLGIGVTDIADTIKLHVAGHIKSDGKVYANQFIAGTSTFPDYVFEAYYNGSSDLNPSYRFQSLNETESFIKEKGHLPGFTPAKEVINTGTFDMTKTAITSVEKIEEIYLHLIQMEKRLKEVEDENKALKKIIQNR